MGNNSEHKSSNRRQFIRLGSAATTMAIAGCQGENINPLSEATDPVECPVVNVPDSTRAPPESEQFYKEMLTVVGTLRNPWKQSVDESIDELGDKTRTEAASLLLPGIREKVLSKPVDQTLTLIETTAHAFNLVAAAGETLLQTQFRNSTEDIGPQTLNKYYTDINRPLGQQPEPKIDLPTTVELPRNQPFAALGNVLEISLMHPYHDDISASEAKSNAGIVSTVLTQQFIPHLQNKEFVLADGASIPLTGCSTGNNNSTDSAQAATLLYNLELLSITAQTIANALDPGDTTSAGNQGSEPDLGPEEVVRAFLKAALNNNDTKAGEFTYQQYDSPNDTEIENFTIVEVKQVSVEEFVASNTRSDIEDDELEKHVEAKKEEFSEVVKKRGVDDYALVFSKWLVEGEEETVYFVVVKDENEWLVFV